MTPLPSADQLRKWGREALEQIRRELYLPESKLYAEEIKGGRLSGPSYNWPAGVMLSALNAGARADKKYVPWLREYADASHIAFWNPAGPVPGYDSNPFPKGPDRYYDDNAWMVLQLQETSEILGDKKYLGWAAEAMRYVLSGLDDQLGGGIYWRENAKHSKNTCSNAPSAYAAFRLGDSKTGHEIVAWMMPRLQDPVDALMWDSINLSEKVERTKWSYNTALAIRALLMDGQRDKAIAMADSGVQHWIDPETGGIKDGAAFAHLLCEALLDVAKATRDTKYRDTVLRALAALHDRGRDAAGHYPNGWNSTAKPVEPVRLIDQASAVRGFFDGAEALRR